MLPLQIGYPGGNEILLLNLLIALVVGYFTYRDAQGRDANPILWALVMALASLLLSIIGFVVVFVVYYLLVVRDSD